MDGTALVLNAVDAGWIVNGCLWILSGNQGKSLLLAQRNIGERYRQFQKIIMG
jgi:hypothetical protein